MAPIYLKLYDGTQIVVPYSLDQITPYVLMEQQDWFEDEIKFVRRMLKPGQHAIDIGANYGVYALTMARAVGGSGRVWAFEPASATASLLSASIAANAYTHVTLEQSALSNTCGQARLALNSNAELNALISTQAVSHASEAVAMVTLDECLARYDWDEMDFLKIDAEGEEARILEGGQRFFSTLSPLVQYEIKAGEHLQLDLVQRFQALGYTSYRLVPGLDVLIPFDNSAPPDGYLLNLFCCKQDRARQLADQGYLWLDPVKADTDDAQPDFSALVGQDRQSLYSWRETLANLPYGQQLNRQWEEKRGDPEHAVIESALWCYAFSLDASQPAGERVRALSNSYRQLNVLCRQSPSYLRWASLARVAADYGARSSAVAALAQAVNTSSDRVTADFSEPFLAPARRFDLVDPEARLTNWCLAAVLEAYEQLGAFSSFYWGASALNRLQAIHTLGFVSAEMTRRLNLLRRRFGFAH